VTAASDNLRRREDDPGLTNDTHPSHLLKDGNGSTASCDAVGATQFRGWLEDKNFIAAANYPRREHLASDQIMIAGRGYVADSGRDAVKRLLHGRRA
jgi:hypothetical protein